MSLIILSIKPPPGSAVTRTTSQSESTFVPPVTALRSPPDSRMTGALSPVIALSSTDAIPSMTSPSAGMRSPASTRTISSFFKSVDATDGVLHTVFADRRRSFAGVSRRAFRNACACALPLPSATASAKLAKRTVNQSQSDTVPINQAGASPDARPVPESRGLSSGRFRLRRQT